MLQHALPYVLTVLELLHLTRACPFHGQTETHAPLINHRRSVPETYSRTGIEHIRVFDGQHFSPPQTVCLDGGYIVALGGCDAADTRINATGKFLIPGLIDSHLHLTDVQSLENFTSYGCTTAMHMDCKNYTQCDILANQPGLASFIHAGKPAVGNGSAHARQDPTRPKNTLIYPDTNVTQFVEWQMNNGSDFMKVTAEVNGPSTQQQIEMVQLVRHHFHKQTMTHASDINAYHQAIESDTDGIQHVPDDGILDNATIHRISRQNQFVTPTLNIFEYAYNNPTILQYFDVGAGGNRTLLHAETNAKLLYKAGIPMILGTDSVGPFTQNGTLVTVPFGVTVHQELQNLVNVIGMSPAEAINAATREAAKWHRVPDRGSIEVGKRADLLVLNSNPLDKIDNTLDIERAWVLGIEVSHLTKLS